MLGNMKAVVGLQNHFGSGRNLFPPRVYISDVFAARVDDNIGHFAKFARAAILPQHLVGGWVLHLRDVLSR